MKICIYTVYNERYLEKLNMMLDSFFLYNTTKVDFHILSCNKSDKKINHNSKIINHDVSVLYNNYLNEKHRPSHACKKIKSLLYQIINIYNYDIVIYTDCDVLFFKDISCLLENKNFNNNIYFSYDGIRPKKYIEIQNKICTGFFIFSPNKFPYLLQEWSVSIDELIKSQPRYLDQPAMKNIILSKKYNDRISLIPLHQISMKFKRKNAMATHYIKKHINKMKKDYINLIKDNINDR